MGPTAADHHSDPSLIHGEAVLPGERVTFPCHATIAAVSKVCIWSPFDFQPRRLQLKWLKGHDIVLPPIKPTAATVYFYPKPDGPTTQLWLLCALQWDTTPVPLMDILPQMDPSDNPLLLQPLGGSRVEMVMDKRRKAIFRVVLSGSILKKLATIVGDPSQEGFPVFSRLVPSIKSASWTWYNPTTALWWIKL